MDAATRSSYEAALRQAEAELAGHEARGNALRQTIDALKSLLALAPAKAAKAPAKRRAAPKRRRRTRVRTGKGHPPIREGMFSGLGPTAAYRKFVAAFGADFPVPAIRDALLAGGVNTTSSTSLLTGLHSVRRRDALQEQAEKAKAEAAKKSEDVAEKSDG